MAVLIIMIIKTLLMLVNNLEVIVSLPDVFFINFNVNHYKKIGAIGTVGTPL